MYRIKTFNKIAPQGLERLDPARYQVGEDVAEEEGILVRSANLLDYPFPDSLLAIARAGVGVNNIPLERCSENGVAVFSTPGANANAVKELVLCGMLISSRDVTGAVRWVKNQAASGVEVETVVEKGKAAFVGPELYRKALGVIGLGAIGSLAANAALDLGMDVYGFDPFLSVDAALRLDRHVRVVQDVNELYKKSDYITIHIHFNEKTRHMIGPEAFAAMKPGARLINLARGGAMPHLGASTPESEQNCAVMAAEELWDYLENGNIKNSVNLPDVYLDRSGAQRLCVLHKNIPAMLASITALLSRDGVNVENLSNKSKGDYAYTLVDLGAKVEPAVLEELRTLPNVIRVRAIG